MAQETIPIIIIGLLIGFILAYFGSKLLEKFVIKRLKNKAKSQILKQNYDYVLDGKKLDIEKTLDSGEEVYEPKPVKKEKLENNDKNIKRTRKGKKTKAIL